MIPSFSDGRTVRPGRDNQGTTEHRTFKDLAGNGKTIHFVTHGINEAVFFIG
jgi:hypothetical protein